MAKYNFNAELYDNPLTEKEGDYIARPTVNTTIRNEQIAERIVEERTEYRPETIANILDLADKKKAEAIAQGCSVIDGVGQYLVGIKGVFDGPSDKFDPARHSLAVSYNPGQVVRKLFADTAVNVTKAATTGPIIGKVIDLKTGNMNDTLSPGKIVQVNGSNIKIAGSVENLGLFFVSEDGTTVTHSELLSANSPTEVTGLIPALADGLYRIRIVTQYASGGKLTKEARTADFPILLTVGDNGGDDRPEIE